MSGFITSLVMLLFSINSLIVPQKTQEALVKRFEESFQLPEETLPDKADPQGKISEKSSSTPSNSESENNHLTSQEDKVDTFNTKSQKVIGQVAAAAVEKSEPLIPCSSADPNPCEEKLSPTPLPISTPTPTPIPTLSPAQDLPKPTPWPCPPPPCQPYLSEESRFYPCPVYADKASLERVCLDN